MSNIDEKYLGLHAWRLEDSPQESKIVQAWAEHLKRGSRGGGDELDSIMSDYSPNGGMASTHDRNAVNTFVQWLGTPVGKRFITQAISDLDWDMAPCPHCHGDPHDCTHMQRVCRVGSCCSSGLYKTDREYACREHR